MTQQATKTKVLITVMTYPHPSKTYRELVCTAGITEDGEWVRLYPIDYRYRPPGQRFHKYQWIAVDLEPRGSGNDNRKESRKPRLESIEVLGPPIPVGKDWRARRQIIDPMPHRTVSQLQAMYESDRVSIGIVRPKRVFDVVIEKADPEWKTEWQAELNQLRLFDPPPKRLRKLPYKFSYVFECEDSTRPIKRMIGDWELGVLFLKEADRLNSEEAAAESVKTKFFNQICSPERDTRFFMGTVFPFNSWIIYGVFWPPKTSQSHS